MSILLRLADALNQDDDVARRLNIALAAVAGLITHGLALWLGRNMSSAATPWFALPNWVNAAIWLVLLMLLGISRWLLNSYTIIGVSTARMMVTLLILCCLLWPLYTLPVVDLRVALSGNIATAILALTSIVVVRRRSVEASSLVMPVAVWLVFSTLVVVASLGWIG